MNFVKMAAGADDIGGAGFMNIEAEAELKMILDDDSGEYVAPGEGQEGFKVLVGLFVPQPVFLSGGVVTDGMDGIEVSLCATVFYPDGTAKNYVPTINSTKILWMEAA